MNLSKFTQKKLEEFDEVINKYHEFEAEHEGVWNVTPIKSFIKESLSEFAHLMGEEVQVERDNPARYEDSHRQTLADGNNMTVDLQEQKINKFLL